jgi:hypothetical protein
VIVLANSLFMLFAVTSRFKVNAQGGVVFRLLDFRVLLVFLLASGYLVSIVVELSKEQLNELVVDMSLLSLC